ncbi:hypothetical protein H4582DRAFT_2077208 [Lactarius indigo]|nr:hypothetical protein H4582DRAFT_2077208 [Lactarius indigo]
MCIDVAFFRLSSRDPLENSRDNAPPCTVPSQVPNFRKRGVTLGTQKYDRFIDFWTRLTFLRGFRQVFHPPISTSTSYLPSTAPSFLNALLPLAFPSAQIGAKTRKQEFSLLASPPLAVDLFSTIPTLATLFQSSPPTLFDASCIRVRTTSITPDYVLLTGRIGRTVIFCVELEHPSQAPEGYLVEAVNVTLGWAGREHGRLFPIDGKSPSELFPLRLSTHE